MNPLLKMISSDSMRSGRNRMVLVIRAVFFKRNRAFHYSRTDSCHADPDKRRIPLGGRNARRNKETCLARNRYLSCIRTVFTANQ